MYNGKIINQLLENKGVKKNELLKYLGWTCYTQLRQATEGNPSVKTLEAIADFFEVSTDVFFEREVATKDIAISPELVTNKELSYKLEVANERLNSIQSLLSEKEKQIALYEEMINIYRQQYPNITTDNK